MPCNVVICFRGITTALILCDKVLEQADIVATRLISGRIMLADDFGVDYLRIVMMRIIMNVIDSSIVG